MALQSSPMHRCPRENLASYFQVGDIGDSRHFPTWGLHEKLIDGSVNNQLSLRRLQLNSLRQLCRRGPTRSRFLLKSQIRSYKLDDALRLSSSFPYLLYAQLLPLQGNTTVTRPFWALELGTLATSPVTPLWLLGLLGTAQVRDGDK